MRLHLGTWTLTLSRQRRKRCPKCVELGSKSRVLVPEYSTSTSMAGYRFYDEQGRYHSHDPNTTGTTYRCSQGHRWHESRPGLCPVKGCEWNKDRQVSIRLEEEEGFESVTVIHLKDLNEPVSILQYVEIPEERP